MDTVLIVSMALLWIVVIVLGVLLLGVIRLVHGDGAAPRADSNPAEIGFSAGQIAPAFSGVNRFGEHVSSEGWGGKTHALLFVSPTCSTCTATLIEMEALNVKTQSKIVVVCDGTAGACSRILSSDQFVAETVIDDGSEVTRMYGVSSFPTAVVIDEFNRVQSAGHPMRGSEIEEIVESQPLTTPIGG